ncbi:hypothetical protein SDC9_194804 [bioreactor metagenome]|uniref:Uncharacterized protein n=1 Tax=bioreactor metagenome TaxID=1076179 RepID=A0A645IIN0_9ZZZZ
MRRGVAGVGADGHLQRRACLVILVLPGVEHRQVVVRLRQLGVVLGQAGEGLDGVARLARLGLDHALEKAHLRIARLGGQVLLDLGQCVGQLAAAHQLADVGVVVGARWQGGGECSSQRQQAQGMAQGRA